VTEKIILGTAQFGMDYGIRNSRGKIPPEEVFKILDDAAASGIDTLDTAQSYGESEKVIGVYLKSSKKKLQVITKIPACAPQEVDRIFSDSLHRLGCDIVYGCLVHDFASYRDNKAVWKRVENIKRQRKASKIGFSLYYPHELESIFKDRLDVDIVQIPLSIFDQRFSGYLPQLKKRNIEVHARSVFLQGLLFEKPEGLDAYFVSVKDKLKSLNQISAAKAVPIFALCLNFIAQNKFINKVVIGIDAKGHLDQILGASEYAAKTAELTKELSDLRVDEERIILPFHWKSKKRFK